MNPDISAAPFFANLIVVTVLILPFYHMVKIALFRRAILILAGLYMLFLIAPRLLVFYVAFWTLLWALLYILKLLTSERSRKSFFILILVFFLLPMTVWKILPEWFTSNFNLLSHNFLWSISKNLGTLDAQKNAIIIVGLSFNTFRAVEMIIRAYLGIAQNIRVQDILFYGFFPPVLFVGPIIEPEEIDRDLSTGRITASDIADGAKLIATGLLKIYVLAMPLEQSSMTVQGFDHVTGPELLLGVILFAWYFYFNFAGYSDLAIGCARLFGFRLKDNFNYPFFQPNLQKFWSNWHMSLTRFAQRNVYVPLGGFRRNTQYFAITGTIMTIALWHDISLNLFIFGIYHAIGLCLTRYYSGFKANRKNMPDKYIVRWLKSGAVFCYVMFSMPLVVISSGDIISFYSKLTMWWF